MNRLPIKPNLWLCALQGLLIGIVVCITQHAFGHDSWVNAGNYKNKAGEWCCGDYDCKGYTQTQSTDKGWIISDGGKDEFIPYDAAETIDKVVPPDGGVTICRRPDGSPRCVFGLKPGG
jgi:hypothetical protein